MRWAAADGSAVALLDRHETLNALTIIVLAICALLVPLVAAAQGDRVPADKTLSPYFFVEGGDPAIDRLPLKDTRVDVAITGVIADVTVRQVYENLRNAAHSCPLRLSCVHAGRGVRHDDDRRRRAHRGQNQGAQAGRA